MGIILHVWIHGGIFVVLLLIFSWLVLSIHEQFGMPIFPTKSPATGCLMHLPLRFFSFNQTSTGMDRGTHGLQVILFPYESRVGGVVSVAGGATISPKVSGT